MASAIRDRAPARMAGVAIALCFAVALLEGYDIQAMGVAAPKMVPALGLDRGETGWALSASMIGLVVGAVVGGRLADMIGRKPVLVWSVAAFGVFSVATIFTRDYPSLLMARIATGLGLGGAMPNLIAIAAEISPTGRRSLTTAMMFCGLPLGGAGSALFARYAPHGLDWRWVFLVGGVLPLVIAPLTQALMIETRPASPAESAAGRNTWTVLFGDGRGPATLLLWVSYGLTLLVMYLLLNWLPLLTVAKGLPAADASLTSLSFNLTAAVGSVVIGALVDRMGPRWPLAAVYAGLVLVMVALAGAAGLAPVLLFSGLAGLFVIGAQYALYGAAPAYYPAEARATGAGAAVAFGRLGSIAGPLIGGYLLKGGASAGQVLAAMVPVVVGAGLAAVLLTFIKPVAAVEAGHFEGGKETANLQSTPT